MKLRPTSDPRFTIYVAGMTLAALAVVGMIFGLWTHYVSTHRESTKVVSFSWERSIDLEDYRTVSEDAWSVPPSGRLTRSWSAYHHTDRVYSGSHEECSGYGKQKSCYSVSDYRNVDVYQTRYAYDIERWVFVRALIESDSGQHAVWPGLELLGLDATEVIGHVRPGGEHETYTVVLDRGGKLGLISRTAGEAVWTKLVVGQSLSVNATNAGTVRSVAWPKSV
jgi:hypothetical protein